MKSILTIGFLYDIQENKTAIRQVFFILDTKTSLNI
jgi:hypothetical protein